MASPAAFPLVSNLNGLLNGQAKGIGIIGTANVLSFDDVVAPIQIVLSSAPASGGVVEFYALLSEDQTTWTDGISPTANADQSALVRMARKIGYFNVDTGLATTYVFDEFSFYSFLGFTPMFWSILVFNKSGVSFAGSGHIAQHSLQNPTAPAPVQYA